MTEEVKEKKIKRFKAYIQELENRISKLENDISEKTKTKEKGDTTDKDFFDEMFDD